MNIRTEFQGNAVVSSDILVEREFATEKMLAASVDKWFILFKQFPRWSGSRPEMKSFSQIFMNI